MRKKYEKEGEGTENCVDVADREVEETFV